MGKPSCGVQLRVTLESNRIQFTVKFRLGIDFLPFI